MQARSDMRADTLGKFRERLLEAIQESGSTRAAVAERVGVDRSTLTQLLSQQNTRLPRLDTAVALAVDQGVSLDWLPGLTNEGPMQAAMIDTEFAPSGRVHNDEQLLAWFAESVGHKTRHVPSTIPDLVKTEAVLKYESTLREQHSGELHARVEASASRLALARSAAAELEVCTPFQNLTLLADGRGVWANLNRKARVAQLEQIAGLSSELYPRFRWFLFDGSTDYSAAITIFGPVRAALYLGQNYLVLTSVEHIRVLIRDFDELIRAARVQPPDIAEYISRLTCS